MQRLDLLKKGLTKWAGQIKQTENGEVFNRKLLELVKAERDDMNLAEMIDTKIQLNFEIEKGEYYWEQRARLKWLKFGDRNTFFLSQATQIQRRNQINKL